MLFLAQYGLRHGVDIEINWPGRISVFPIMGGIWLALFAPGWVATALVVWGLAMAILATVLYARSGRRAVQARARCKLTRHSGATFNLELNLRGRSTYNRPPRKRRRPVRPEIGARWRTPFPISARSATRS